ncbi:MAG: glutamate racemase, partial [Chloroflexi bacterium]|nr:glutamate racemase [Chloroflexota bacterium]
LYFADAAHCPYGAKSAEEIRQLSRSIVECLLANDAKLIVVACNTASVASLAYLRANFSVPFVGIVPAVKPAAQTTQSKRIGVLATNATFQAAIFDDLIEKFASDTAVVRQICPGWVELVEQGKIDGAEAEGLVARYVAPLLQDQIDTLVLGCTHYPFLRPLIESFIQKTTGAGINVVDPAPAVARQVGRVMAANGLDSSRSTSGSVRYFTTGDAEALRQTVRKLLGREILHVEHVDLVVAE